MTERRKFLRFDTAFDALCELVSEKHKASYKVANVSKEGALILLDKKLDNGSNVNMSMEIPGDNIPVFANCEVAWQDRSVNSNTYETGLKFKNINSLDKGRLLEYIYLQWLRLIERE